MQNMVQRKKSRVAHTQVQYFDRKENAFKNENVNQSC